MTQTKNGWFRWDSRGFVSIAPLVIVLAVVLVGIFIWRGVLMLEASSGSSAYAGGRKAGAVGAMVIGPILCFVIAGGVGALAYWMFGKSEGAANGGMVLVLIAAIGLFGYGTYVGSAKVSAAVAAGGQIPPATTARERMQKMSDNLQAQQSAMRDAAERARQQTLDRSRAMQTGTPMPPPSRAETGPTSSRPSIGTREAAAPRPNVARDDSVHKAAIDRVLESSKEAIDTSAKRVVASVKPLLDGLGKPPRNDIRELRQRLVDITAARGELTTFKDALQKLEADVREQLSGAGVPESESAFAVVRFVQDVNQTTRVFGTDGLIHLLDEASNETTILRDNLGKWSFDKTGRITSKDFQVQSSAQSARFMLESDLRRKDQMLDQILGR